MGRGWFANVCVSCLVDFDISISPCMIFSLRVVRQRSKRDNVLYNAVVCLSVRHYAFFLVLLLIKLPKLSVHFIESFSSLLFRCAVVEAKGW